MRGFSLNRGGAIAAGGLLLAAYASLVLFLEPRAELGRALAYVGWKEGLFWWAHFALATPGLMLVGYGLAPGLGPLLRHLIRRLTERPGARRLGAGILVLVLFAGAVVGRGQLLLHLPLTDDENGVLFGARMVAEGLLTVPALEPREALPLPFVLTREGRMCSFDFPGAIFFAAASLASGLGSVLYAALAALSGLAVAWSGWCLAGRRGGLAAGLLWLVSPMVLALSYTTHAQLLSRSLVALATACYCALACRSPRPRVGVGALLGLAAGLAFLCRPFEAACMLAPMAAHLLFKVARERRLAWPVAAAAGVGLLAALVFAWYNLRTTGAWYLPARFAPEVVVPAAGARQAAELGLGTRLGLNLGFNLMMLLIWFLGPLGAVLVGLGLRARWPVAAVLGSGVGLQLLLALAHDDTGIHTVGPIHYSECAVPLTLVATLGLAAAWRLLARLSVPPSGVLVGLACYLLGLVLFSFVHSFTLYEQARIQQAPLAAIRDLGLRQAVVVADPPERLWEMRPEMRHTRSWVTHLPHPDPLLRDEVIFVYPTVPLAALAVRFPDRSFYRMTYHPVGEAVTIHRLPGNSPSASPSAGQGPIMER